MNITKVLIIALIASASTLFTLWIAASMTVGGWYIPITVLAISAFITDRMGLGSISEFFELQ
jgi:hypothetical protein